MVETERKVQKDITLGASADPALRDEQVRGECRELRWYHVKASLDRALFSEKENGYGLQEYLEHAKDCI